MKADSLSKRMKTYEKSIEIHLLKKCPAILRIDMKCGHSFCKHMEKPFDKTLNYCMVNACIELAKEIQGFKFGYTQSDEASFMFTDYDTIDTEGWFGYDKDKIVSVSASIFTKAFNKLLLKQELILKYNKQIVDKLDAYYYIDKFKFASFDSRAFNIPKDDVANYFLWRAKDWNRNSIQMFARSFFSHKELHGKRTTDIHEMLYSIGKNWVNDVPDNFRNGTFLYKDYDNKFVVDSTIKDNYNEISERLKYRV